jgi:hypothetical protein
MKTFLIMEKLQTTDSQQASTTKVLYDSINYNITIYLEL